MIKRMNMNKTTLHIALTLCAAATLTGCARSSADTTADDNKEYFDAWRSINYPDAQKKGLGIYILPDREVAGSGAAWNRNLPCSFVSYTIQSLSGAVSYNSEEAMARQLGTYDKADYYGPQVVLTGTGVSYAGLDELLDGMKVGGSRTAIIPSWLMTTSRYDTEEEYIAHIGSASSAIYTITLHGQTSDIKQWAYTTLQDYTQREWAVSDTTTTGVFFKSFTPEASEAVASDSTVYVNYTGRRLDGQVFDTTIEKVAKDNNIYVSGKTYAPVPVVWNETATEITLNGSTIVTTGFAEGLYQMHQDEKAAFAFTYDKGYGTSGSGTLIPGYASLIFEVELVPAP